MKKALAIGSIGFLIAAGVATLSFAQNNKVELSVAAFPSLDDSVKVALAGFANRNMILMVLLLAVLLFEQWLAWSASYHLPGGKR